MNRESKSYSIYTLCYAAEDCFSKLQKYGNTALLHSCDEGREFLQLRPTIFFWQIKKDSKIRIINSYLYKKRYKILLILSFREYELESW